MDYVHKIRCNNSGHLSSIYSTELTLYIYIYICVYILYISYIYYIILYYIYICIIYKRFLIRGLRHRPASNTGLNIDRQLVSFQFEITSMCQSIKLRTTHS